MQPLGVIEAGAGIQHRLWIFYSLENAMFFRGNNVFSNVADVD